MAVNLNRRQFLKLSGSAAGSVALFNMGGISSASAGGHGDYKALVCVFLGGGNDAFNWIVPQGNGYTTYAESRSTLALPQATLLPLTGAASDGDSYGMHPACPELQSLFNDGDAAVICNVGSLIQPTTAAEARSRSAPLPLNLFSHSDQSAQWMTSRADSASRIGWAGRVADLLQQQGNTGSLPPNISIAGSNYWQAGNDTLPYSMSRNGVTPLQLYSNTGYHQGRRRQLFSDLLTQAGFSDSLLTREYANIQARAATTAEDVSAIIDNQAPLATDFPDTALGRQLQMVARTIGARDALGADRQLFFVSIGGFDTHDGQLPRHAQLLGDLSQSLGAFKQAVAEVGAEDGVVSFTASDFGRTLTSNGDGSDHAWGSHAMVTGKPVAGRKFYGTMPNLEIDGPDDVRGGRLAPTTSTDQYAATLVRWLGLEDADIDAIFPNLANFNERDLQMFNDEGSAPQDNPLDLSLPASV